MSTPTWGGRAVTRLRAYFATTLPTPCGRCKKTVRLNDVWVIGHIQDRAVHPELTWELTNMRVEHRACSDKTGQAAVIAKARAQGRADAENVVQLRPDTDGDPAFLRGAPTYGRRRPFPDTPPSGSGVRRFDPRCLEGIPWLADLMDIPDDAAWPRAMSPPHPDAVGSYGLEAEAWLKAELKIELRWWQRLAMRRQLEHDAEGELVWGQVIESTPRRAGKSVRLRCIALWRISHAALLGEDQLVLHTGKDLPIAKEIHRKAWRWAEERSWTVKRQNGNEEIETSEGSRWIVRGRDSVYGYDVGMGMVDEAWGVEPSAIDEGLEPALLERCNPQLHLTSTAHRRASSLMKRRMEAAVIGLGEDRRTLLMWWGADDGCDVTDPAQWRLASPHWTTAREELISDKLDRAVRGEADPDADDPDPIEGFKAQYLNLWPPANAPRMDPGEAAFTDTEWTGLLLEVDEPPVATEGVVAIEGWFTEGVCVAHAWLVGGTQPIVAVSSHGSLSEAIKAMGTPRQLVVGKSLAEDPQLLLLGPEPIGGTTRQAVTTLRQLANDGLLRHDGGDELTAQVLGLRVVPGADGPRIKTGGRADAVKAASWALERVRRSTEPPAIF